MWLTGLKGFSGKSKTEAATRQRKEFMEEDSGRGRLG